MKKNFCFVTPIEFLNTINFNERAIENLNALQKIQPNRCLYVPELWSGWFDLRGGKHNRMSIKNHYYL